MKNHPGEPASTGTEITSDTGVPLPSTTRRFHTPVSYRGGSKVTFPNLMVPFVPLALQKSQQLSPLSQCKPDGVWSPTTFNPPMGMLFGSVSAIYITRMGLVVGYPLGPSTNLNGKDGVGVAVGGAGVKVAVGGRGLGVFVGGAGVNVAVGGTGVGVSVGWGVGVMVGVGVGIGVRVNVGVGVQSGVGVNVGRGVLVGVTPSATACAEPSPVPAIFSFSGSI